MKAADASLMTTARNLLKSAPALSFLWRRLLVIQRDRLISDEAHIRRLYEARLGKQLNLDTPQTFNEKIQWLKLYWRDRRAIQCADKYAVREFVASRIDKAHLNELYAVYRRVEEIDLAALPQAFVLKATHGSGWNFICKNKDVVHWGDVFIKFKKWLRTNYYYCSREWAYRHIPPRIICEKYLVTNTGQPPWDYKLFCFGGKPKLIQVDLGRFTDHRRNMYDVAWKRMPFALAYPFAKHEVERPKTLAIMLDIASRLSHGFPFVRVDLYELGTEVYFGEMTFYPGNGAENFYPPDYDGRLGECIRLPRQ